MPSWVTTVSLVANLVLLLAFLITGRSLLPGSAATSTRDPVAAYPYLSKRLFAEKRNDILINFIPLRTALRDYVGGLSGMVGVYFEYLPSGTSIGVNDREEIQLTSLSKVPLVMSVLKKVEQGELALTDQLTIETEHLDNRFGTLWRRGAGTKLTVEELIRLSLVESDNTAYRVLFAVLQPQEINKVYEGLDIQITQAGEQQAVSPKSYSSIFRSLYLASFLSQENSNRILKILTATPFDDKITAAIPRDIPVAHKIGVFSTADDPQEVFIDCGIVYIPARPYILCIFVQDTNERAQQHMVHISKMVYEYLIQVRGG